MQEKMISQEIYDTLKNIKENINFLDIPEIKNAIMKFEDAITCIIHTPKKLNPNLPYNLQLIVSSLIDVLKDTKKKLRKSQIASIIYIIDHIISGRTKGLIKLPTGAGKTKLFSEIVTGLNLPTLILVPKINLKSQTSEYFEGDHVFNIGENGTVLQNTRKIMRTIEQNNISHPIIIATYQSFIRLKEDQALFEAFSKLIKVVIRDEAHRSLGDKTQESLDEMSSYSDEVISEEQDKDLLQTDVLYSNEKLELLFTATPKLLDKNVKDTYDEIFALRFQDLVEEGVLHMPTFIQVSEASIHIGDTNIGEKVLNQFATKFVNEKGEYTYIEITDTYLELKEKNNGYLPAVGFCRDIEHAEFMKNYLGERGIRAIRVTSENNKYDAGVPENEATRMLEENEVDIVVTVTKVSEGWDVPILRCALNYAPIFSEGKYIQGIGRIGRIFDFEQNKQQNIANNVRIKDFSFVIEPKFWNISSGSGRGQEPGSGLIPSPEPVEWIERKQKTTKISGITHLIDSGEFDINYLRDLYGDINEYSQFVTPEEILEYFQNEKTFDEWMELKEKDIKEIEWKEKSIRALVSLSGWDNQNNVNVQNPLGFQEFIAWVFEKEVRKNTPEEVLEYFKTQHTYDEWMKFKKTDIDEINFQGKKITNLATLCGWDNSNNVTIHSSSGFQKFIAWIFEKELEKIPKEEILEYFKTKHTYDEWMKFKQKDIKEIEWKEKSIRALASLSGWDNPNNINLQTPSGFQEFIAWVFGKESKRKIEKITKEEVIKYFKTQHTYNEWMNFKKRDIKEIAWKEKMITALISLSGWKNPNNVRGENSSGFQEFIAWVFEKKVGKKKT